MPVNSSQPCSIFGLGTILVDHQAILPAFPDPDTKAEVVADRFQVGGPVPTALCLLQGFGLKTRFQGQWSNDAFGQMIEADLNKHGIHFIPPKQHPLAQTGFAHVWIEQPTGRRTTAAFRGSHEIEPDQFHPRHLADHHALHLDGWHGDASINAARAMQAQGGQVFLDLGSPKPHLDKLLPHVNLLSCPERLIQRLFGKIDPETGARRLLKQGPSEIVVTRGDQGARHYSNSETTNQSGFKVDAVDTNGAGDVFVGALIYASIQQWPTARRLQFACAAAALKCTRLGNREALPTLDQIKTFLA